MNTLNKKSPIGLFDSGVGGLTVLKRLKEILPDETYIYYGDTEHMPYGEKTKAQLIEYSTPIFNFFKKKGCKAVVMACNTTSSNIFTEVKDKYDFKMYSIVHSISEILSKLPVKKLGILATRATIESGAYQNIINSYNHDIRVIGQSCPDWVHIVEDNTEDLPDNIDIIKQDLASMLKNKPERIVLGCTHYPYLLDTLSKFAPRDMFIDPAADFAKYIKNDLAKNDLLNNEKTTDDEFFVSSEPENFRISAQMFYKLTQDPALLPF